MLAKRFGSLCKTTLAPQRYVSEDQDLPTHVEVDLVGELEELYQYIGVVGGGADRILLSAVIQDELERELARRSTLLLAPVRVHISDLANLDALLGVLFGHSNPPVVSLYSLSQRDVVGDKYLPIEVEIDGIGPLEELDHDLRVLSGGLQDVLLGPTVQDQLHRECTVFPTTAFGPRNLHVRDLADPDRLLGVLLRHLVSLLPRDWQPYP